MKKMYILGADASKADGLSMQAELLKYIFEFKMSNTVNQANFLNMHVEHYSADIDAAYKAFTESRKQLAIFLPESFDNDAQAKLASDMRMHLDNRQRSLEEQLAVENMWNCLLAEARKVNVKLEDVFSILDKAVIE